MSAVGDALTRAEAERFIEPCRPFPFAAESKHVEVVSVPSLSRHGISRLSRGLARADQFVGRTRAMPADGTLRAKRNPIQQSRRSTGLPCRSAERHSAAGSL